MSIRLSSPLHPSFLFHLRSCRTAKSTFPSYPLPPLDHVSTYPVSFGESTIPLLALCYPLSLPAAWYIWRFTRATSILSSRLFQSLHIHLILTDAFLQLSNITLAVILDHLPLFIDLKPPRFICRRYHMPLAMPCSRLWTVSTIEWRLSFRSE